MILSDGEYERLEVGEDEFSGAPSSVVGVGGPDEDVAVVGLWPW